ncbi:MAG: hypothetical protein NWP83_07075, partial [Spirosomaceae bacterium]|nr:hypothetical protein [Spirosomataceae bacterium]
MKSTLTSLLIAAFFVTLSCQSKNEKVATAYPSDSLLQYTDYKSTENEIQISRSEYADKLYGFWLG